MGGRVGGGGVSGGTACTGGNKGVQAEGVLRCYGIWNVL